MSVLYLLTIAVANVLTARFSPLVLLGGTVIIPIGSFMIGMTFMLRDLVQMRHGKRKTYFAMFAAFLLSAGMSLTLGDTAHIAIASAVSFFVSETIDTEIFSRLQKSFAIRVMISGAVGGLADSTLFVVVGLSPIGANVLSWSQIPYAVIGQTVVKAIMQTTVIGIRAKQRRKGR